MNQLSYQKLYKNVSLHENFIEEGHKTPVKLKNSKVTLVQAEDEQKLSLNPKNIAQTITKQVPLKMKLISRNPFTQNDSSATDLHTMTEGKHGMSTQLS